MHPTNINVVVHKEKDEQKPVWSKYEWCKIPNPQTMDGEWKEKQKGEQKPDGSYK